MLLTTKALVALKHVDAYIDRSETVSIVFVRSIQPGIFAYAYYEIDRNMQKTLLEVPKIAHLR